MAEIEIGTRGRLQEIAALNETPHPAITRLEDFRFEDFTLAGYEPHPHISAPVAV